jgi:hypothetical protein
MSHEIEMRLGRVRGLLGSNSSLTVAKIKVYDFKHITGLKKFLAPQIAL